MKPSSMIAEDATSLNAHRRLHIFTRLAVAVLFGLSALSTGMSQPRNLLGATYSSDALKAALLPQTSWHPFPKAGERKAWEELPAGLKAEYIKRGEQALDYQWPSIPITLYLDYFRTGSRENFSRLFSERRQKVTDLVLAECAEGKGRFLDKIAHRYCRKGAAHGKAQVYGY